MASAPIDVVFISLGLILIVRCALRGFIEEFMSMAAIILGLFTGTLLYKNGAIYIREQFSITVLTELIAFVVLFLIAFVLVKILEYILRDIVDRINLGTVDHLFGVFLGFVEAMIVIMIILFVLQVQPLFNPVGVLENSIFAKYLIPCINAIRGV